MRAQTKGKHNMGKRFALLICVAAVGVVALGAQTVMAQTAAEAPGVVEYPAKLTITAERGNYIHGFVLSYRECLEGREVIVFKKQRGPDSRLATALSQGLPETIGTNLRWPGYGAGDWGGLPRYVGKRVAASHARVYAKVTPQVGDGFVCRGDLSPVMSLRVR